MAKRAKGNQAKLNLADDILHGLQEALKYTRGEGRRDCSSCRTIRRQGEPSAHRAWRPRAPNEVARLS